MDTNKRRQPRKHSNKEIAKHRADFNPQQSKIIEKRMRLAVRIEEGMKAKKWNRKSFAVEMGVNPSVVTQWLSGTHNFTSDTIFSIEEKLDITLMQLFKARPETKVQKYTIVAFANQWVPYTPIGRMLNNLQFPFGLYYSNPTNQLLFTGSKNSLTKVVSSGLMDMDTCNFYDLKINEAAPHAY
jgi:transcriptional regulator with XRE-family HTH domain